VHEFSEENLRRKRHFQKKKQRKNRNLAPQHLFEIKKSREKTRLRALAPSRQNQAKQSKTAKNRNKAKTTKKTLPCKKRITSNL
jgi:hypothetical protein